MQWPFMTRREHARHMRELRDFHSGVVKMLEKEYQSIVDAEYHRAYNEGRSQVHAFAVEVTYNLFHEGLDALSVPRFRQVLQELEEHFNPDKKSVAKWTSVMSAIKEDT